MSDVVLAASTHGHRIRRFANRTGWWVHYYSEWVRPLHVWLHRGAWRVICRACVEQVRSADDMWDDGWPTQETAIEAALAHCATCPDRAGNTTAA